MNEKDMLQQIQYFIKFFPKFSRKHWISSPRFDFIYDFIEQLDKNQNLTSNQKDYIKKKLVSCRYKLCSLEYHDRNIIQIEKKYKKVLTNILKHPSFKHPTTLATYIPEIMFDFEAFLFQCKAFLDIYSKAIGNIFNEKPSNIRKLKSVLLRRKEKLAKDLLDILEKNKWLTEFDSSQSFTKTKRDIVAHYSVISLSWINVQKIDEKRFNTLRTKVENKLVLDYTRDMINKMRRLMISTVRIIGHHQTF